MGASHSSTSFVQEQVDKTPKNQEFHNFNICLANDCFNNAPRGLNERQGQPPWVEWFGQQPYQRGIAFYDELLASDPRIKPMFAQTNMAKQKDLLKHGLSRLSHVQQRRGPGQDRDPAACLET